MLTSNGQILALSPSLTMLVFAAILVACWLALRSQRFLLWQSSAYSLTSIPLGIHSLGTIEDTNRYALLIGGLYLLGVWSLAKSWAERWNVSTLPSVVLGIAICTLAALYYFSRIEQSAWARVSSFSIGCGFVLLIPILQVRAKVATFDRLDKFLFWLSVIFMIYTFTRPLCIWLLGYSDLQSLPSSPYWQLTLVSLLNFALLFTLVMTAIAAKETVGKLRKERDLDALTQILNRRSFLEHAQKHLADARLYPMAVLVCDIDHFKRINDAWGHERGDEVLQLVSATLQNNVRERDLVARFGGEEFVILLTDIALQDAEKIALRIRRDLRSNNAVLPIGATLTMSFGISSITGPSQLDLALREADQLLYQAKNAGRDRVHVSGLTYPDICIDSTRASLGP